ncbi:hypothetical protein ACJX0J_012960 [Zea mays]
MIIITNNFYAQRGAKGLEWQEKCKKHDALYITHMSNWDRRSLEVIRIILLYFLFFFLMPSDAYYTKYTMCYFMHALAFYAHAFITSMKNIDIRQRTFDTISKIIVINCIICIKFSRILPLALAIRVQGTLSTQYDSDN